MTIYYKARFTTAIDRDVFLAANNKLFEVFAEALETGKCRKERKIISSDGTDYSFFLLPDLPANDVYTLMRKWVSLEDCQAAADGFLSLKASDSDVDAFLLEIAVFNDDNF